MLASITHILPLTTIVRTRVLPAPGRVLVQVGQKIGAADVIAETAINRRHAILDVAAMLHLPPEKTDQYIKVRRGQKIAKGDKLAEASGVLAREAFSPIAGRVVITGGGKVVLETGGQLFELRSGLAGTVTEIIPERGAVIRATGLLIQGMWGNGKTDTGILFNMADTGESELLVENLDVSLRGSILLAGHVRSAAVLKDAAELPVRGLILGSMSSTLVGAASQMPYPILLLEGFGNRPISSNIFKLLTTNTKREVTVMAEVFDRTKGSRPELVIPLPVSQEPAEPRDLDTFAPGQQVRIHSLTEAARLGTIEQLRPGLSLLPNGVSARAAMVRLDSGQQMLVPLSNMEVLG